MNKEDFALLHKAAVNAWGCQTGSIPFVGYSVFKNATRSSLSWSDRCKLKRVS